MIFIAIKKIIFLKAQIVQDKSKENPTKKLNFEHIFYKGIL